MVLQAACIVMFLELGTTLGAISGACLAGVMILGYSAVAMIRRRRRADEEVVIGATAAASAGVYFSRGQIDPFIAAPVAIGVLAGAFAGSHTLGRIGSKSVRAVFVVVLAGHRAAQRAADGSR